MARIGTDPSLEECPEYDDKFSRTVTDSLIANPNLPEITNEEQAREHLKDGWSRANAEKRRAWEEQLAADKEVEVQEQREIEEREKLLNEELRRKEQDVLKEKEKSRTYLHPIQFGKGVEIL